MNMSGDLNIPFRKCADADAKQSGFTAAAPSDDGKDFALMNGGAHIADCPAIRLVGNTYIRKL
jgi:hypothetical protein